MRPTPLLLASALLFAALAALNLAVLGWEVAVAPIEPPGGPGPLPAGMAPAASPPQGAALAELSQTVLRPPFSRTRRPRQAAALEGEPRQAEPTEAVEIRLAGVMRVGQSRRRALIVSREHPAGRWMEEGSELAGWRLLEIGDQAIQMEIDGRRQHLKLTRSAESGRRQGHPKQ